MKFIAFNVVVLGALFFLYQVAHAPIDGCIKIEFQNPARVGP